MLYLSPCDYHLANYHLVSYLFLIVQYITSGGSAVDLDEEIRSDATYTIETVNESTISVRYFFGYFFLKSIWKKEHFSWTLATFSYQASYLSTLAFSSGSPVSVIARNAIIMTILFTSFNRKMHDCFFVYSNSFSHLVEEHEKQAKDNQE